MNKIKLLILTQKVDKNDDVLGFFHRWIAEFAKHCEKVTVVCLQKGEYGLPENVKVLTLGKEKRPPARRCPEVFGKLKHVFNFYKHIIRERKNYDAVFVHMNPEYVVLGAPLWKLWGKKTALWYTHRQVNLKLRLAEKLVGKIFSASKESFRLPSRKLKVVGHGIDVEKFNVKRGGGEKGGKLRIVAVGRITRIKNLDTLIEAAAILKEKWGKGLSVKMAGAPAAEGDSEYLAELRKLVKEKGLEGEVVFSGAVPYGKIAEFYAEADASVNLCPTGGLDKAVLESMAAGLPVFTSNKGFAGYFGEYAPKLIFREGDARDLAAKITAVFAGGETKAMGEFLEKKAKEAAGLENLIKRLTDEFNE